MFDPVDGSLHLGDFGPNTLELTGVPSVGYRELRAIIRTPHLTAAITLHELYDVGSFDQLGQLLGGFAADWKGWEGERTWRSADSDLVLVCTHDHVGQVNVGCNAPGQRRGMGVTGHRHRPRGRAARCSFA
jgi:Family of unknown function (DUF6228)